VLAACDKPQQAGELGRKQKILRNDTLCQAVSFPDGMALCAFWQAGAVKLGHGREIRVDGACLVLVSGDTLYVSNPAHQRSAINITYQRRSRHFVLPADGTTVRDQF
jgi:hypothetical protein